MKQRQPIDKATTAILIRLDHQYRCMGGGGLDVAELTAARDRIEEDHDTFVAKGLCNCGQ